MEIVGASNEEMAVYIQTLDKKSYEYQRTVTDFIKENEKLIYFLYSKDSKFRVHNECMIDKEDIINLMRLKFIETIECFDENTNYAFSTLFAKISKNAVNNLRRKFKAKKRNGNGVNSDVREDGMNNYNIISFEEHVENVNLSNEITYDSHFKEDSAEELEGLFNRAKLTKKERRVALLLAENFSGLEIADKLKISSAMVSKYKRKLQNKLKYRLNS